MLPNSVGKKDEKKKKKEKEAEKKRKKRGKKKRKESTAHQWIREVEKLKPSPKKNPVTASQI
jgi:hypothetical protein